MFSEENKSRMVTMHSEFNGGLILDFVALKYNQYILSRKIKAEETK